jgi:hypothetical protein
MDLSATLGFFFTVLQAADIAGVPDEEARCFPEPFKGSLGSLLKGGALKVKVPSVENTKGIKILGRRIENRAHR